MRYQGSRYTGTEVIEPINGQGEHPRVLAPRRIAPPPGVLEYVVLEGERLDHLAHRFYGDPKKYWLLLDANPGVLNPFELLRPGQRIRVPANQVLGP
ncbi:tail protein X [Myxococcus stipitatus]|uniref:LysM peptidoglycan-binding domain-containing protein n=1 Tax=Myxococcus stipitatus TaxID=83455 RepID=UPI001F18309B|nr:tail protein X [Myxococcus stipitatus]MCE9672843.1 tail protein X [Myxococcus stipitatus]